MNKCKEYDMGLLPVELCSKRFDLFFRKREPYGLCRRNSALWKIYKACLTNICINIKFTLAKTLVWWREYKFSLPTGICSDNAATKLRSIQITNSWARTTNHSIAGRKSGI